jgi:hypothetical protein
MSQKNTTWAVLVYLAGDNNLSEEMVWSLQEMKKTIEADTTGVFEKDVKVIAQYDARGANPRTYLLTESATQGMVGVNAPVEPMGDGNLSEIDGIEYSAKEILDCVQKRIEPSPEQWARATFHLLNLSNKEPYKTLTTGTLAKNCGALPDDEAIAFLSEAEANGFLAKMQLLSAAKRRDYTRDDIDDLTIKGAQALPRILKRVLADVHETSQKVQRKRAEQIIEDHKRLLAKHLKRTNLNVAETEAEAKHLFDAEFCNFNPPYLGLLGEDLPIPEWQAVCFVLHLLLHSTAEREELMNEDRTELNEKGNKSLSQLLTLIIQKGSEATKTERKQAESIIKRVGGLVVDQFNDTPVFPQPSQKETTLDLSELISRSSESLSKYMSGLTSAYMAEEFIEKQAKLTGEVNHHLVVLSGHGSGAVGDFLTDDDPESSLSIPILGKLLKSAKLELNDGDKAGETKISILGMDSCLMSMAEVCYEVQDCVEYIVGAEGFVPNTGWPYHRVLEEVAKVAKNNKAPKDLAEEIVRKYVNFYKDYDVAMVSVDLAAIDLTNIGHVGDSFQVQQEVEESADAALEEAWVRKTFVDQDPQEYCNLAELVLFLAKRLTAALKGLELTDELLETDKISAERGCKPLAAIRDAVTLAHLHAQSYKGDQYVDLYDFCEQLKRFCKDKKIRDCAQAIMDKFTDKTPKAERPVLLSCYWGADFQHSHGLSVYFPWSISDYVPEYSNLKFARDTGWDEFIWTYLRSTLRVRRHQEEDNNWVTDSEGEKLPKPPKRFGPEKLSEDFLLLDEKSAQYGTAKSAQYGTAKSSQWGTAKSSQFGTAKSAQYGTARSAQYGTAKSSQWGTAKFLEKCFQSSMKNGPDGFYECKELKTSRKPKPQND